MTCSLSHLSIFSISGCSLDLSISLVSYRKPLHTIEESSEISQNELNSDRNFVCDQNDAHCECEQEDDDMTLSEIRNLFEIPDDRSIVDNEILLDSSLQDDISLDSPYLASPSFSLIQQFEMAAKMEAATYIQKWYRQVRDRQRFLQMKNAALVIQRHFREKR